MASGPDPLKELPRAFNAVDYFIHRHSAEGRADKIAVIDEAGAHSYAALSDRVKRCGSALGALGLAPETRIAMCMVDTADFPTVFWGALHDGIIPVPLNTLLTTEDYDYMLRDSRARALIVSAELYEKFAPIVDAIATLKHIIISGAGSTHHPRLETLLASARPRDESFDATCDDVAFWLYSSGSTGKPKGVIHLHRDLYATARLFGDGILKMSESDVCYSVPKLFFAYGLGNGMSFPFAAGATAIYLHERATPEVVARLVHAHQPTVFFGVPTFYGAMLAAGGEAGQVQFSRLRLCVSAGEALPAEIGKRWHARHGAPILDGLGSTEMLHIFLCAAPEEVRYGTSGKAVPGYQLRIVDEHGNDLPQGELGELIVKGPSSAAGYWNQREKSTATFRGPWTHTGDKYYLDTDGYYHYAGRADDMMKVSGNWVSPAEVEATLVAHPAILEAAVIGADDESGLLKPKAFVVLKDGHIAGATLTQELKVFIKERLAPYKYPRWIIYLDSLPKTATGKIQRFRLRDGAPGEP